MAQPRPGVLISVGAVSEPVCCFRPAPLGQRSCTAQIRRAHPDDDKSTVETCRNAISIYEHELQTAAKARSQPDHPNNTAFRLHVEGRLLQARETLQELLSRRDVHR